MNIVYGSNPGQQASGFSLYNYLITALADISTTSFVALMYGSTIIVPTSACELETTSAQQGLVVVVLAVPIVGAMIGSLLWGYLGDTQGRRRMLLMSLVVAALCNAFASISVFKVTIKCEGFGLYNYLITALAGISTTSFVALMYGSTIIVPTSACELETTSAQQGLVVAVPIAGAMIGSLLWGYLGDTQGRRRMLLMSLVVAALCNAFASISVNWIMLMIVQLFTATLGVGIYVLSLTLLSESVPLRKRNVAMLIVTSILLLGQSIVSLLPIPIIPLTYSYYLPALGIYWNSWRTLQVVYSLPSLLCAFWLIFMQESPKYALARGDEERALSILRNIHRINNGKRAEEFQVKGLLQEAGATAKKAAMKDQIVPLFQAPHLKNTLIMATLFISYQIVVAFMVWAPTIANQLMQLLETGEGSDLTLCQIIATDIQDSDAPPCSINSVAMLLMLAMCGMHSVVNTILSQVVDKAGRRNLAMVVTAVCGLAGVLINLVPSAVGSAVLFLVFTLAVSVVGFYAAITVALFPTHLRTMAVATTTMGGYVASVAFIQIINFLFIDHCELGFYLFCAVFTGSALVLALLPDDRRLRAAPVPLLRPDTLEDTSRKTLSH